jgi:phosphinothricin acetyltransferase
MHIRTARPDDAAAISAIYTPIVEETTISFELQAPTVDEIRSRIVSTLQTLPWLVGEDAQGQLCGYVYASRFRERAAYQWAVEVTAYVRADCRGQGVGKLLYGRLFEVLVELGYHQAIAGITLPNEASVALHEAFGFEPVAHYRSVGYKLGAWRDVGYWQLALRRHEEPSVPSAPRAFTAAD